MSLLRAIASLLEHRPRAIASLLEHRPRATASLLEHRLRAAIVASSLLLAGSIALPALAQDAPPTTEFEDNGGTEWTSHEGELAFLEALADGSARVEVSVVGESVQGRPLHLVEVGHPAPRGVEAAQEEPTLFIFCTQHGNEPAGREACLRWIRDLAFTDDPTLVSQLEDHTIIFMPTANPDGREANTRGNADGIDINRDHLNLETLEARAIARVIRDWTPDMALDHHEYGQTPLFYDDHITYMWPRNLNVHKPVRDLAKTFLQDHIDPCLGEEGFSGDEYGINEFGDQDLTQTAGGPDEGISRNTSGLRHSLGILIESGSLPDPRNPTGELDSAANQNRRVDGHYRVMDCTLEYYRANGEQIRATAEESRVVKEQEGEDRSAPLFFNGQFEDTTVTGSGEAESTSFADPPPCGYLLTAEQAETVGTAFELHDIGSAGVDDGVFVDLGQTAEPVIGLLLDERASRHSVAGEPLDDCAAFRSAGGGPAPAPPPAPDPAPDGPPLPATGAGLTFLGLVLAGVGALRRH